MTTKLTVASRKQENGSVKGKREKEKGFFPMSCFPFRFKTNKGSGKWVFPLPNSLPLPWIQTRPQC